MLRSNVHQLAGNIEGSAQGVNVNGGATITNASVDKLLDVMRFPHKNV